MKLPNNLRLKIVYRNAFCCGNIFIVYWRILKISFSHFSARLDFSYSSSLSLYALLRSCLSHRLIVVGLLFASNWKLECWFEKSKAISRLVWFDLTREVCKRRSISSVFFFIKGHTQMTSCNFGQHQAPHLYAFYFIVTKSFTLTRRPWLSSWTNLYRKVYLFWLLYTDFLFHSSELHSLNFWPANNKTDFFRFVFYDTPLVIVVVPCGPIH